MGLPERSVNDAIAWVSDVIVPRRERSGRVPRDCLLVLETLLEEKCVV